MTHFPHEPSFKLSAHATGTKNFPQNSLEGVKDNIKLGYDCIELDPRKSKDGTVYLMHDETVNRTTNGNGKIQDLTDNQINNLELKKDGYNIKEVLRVPTFESVIQEMSKTSIGLNVDGSKMDLSQDENFEEIERILIKYDMIEKTFFAITDESQMTRFKQKHPNYQMAFVYNQNNGIEKEYQKSLKYNAFMSVPFKYFDDKVYDYLDSRKVYYQVHSINDVLEINKLKGEGVPLVETDIVTNKEIGGF